MVKDLNPRQDRFLKALLESSTIEEACNNAKINRTTGYKYLRDPDFVQEYRAVRRDIMKGVTVQLQQITSQAVATLNEIMLDPNAPATSRVQSAKAIMENVYRSIELDDIQEQLDELRHLVAEKNN